MAGKIAPDSLGDFFAYVTSRDLALPLTVNVTRVIARLEALVLECGDNRIVIQPVIEKLRRFPAELDTVVRTYVGYLLQKGDVAP